MAERVNKKSPLEFQKYHEDINDVEFVPVLFQGEEATEYKSVPGDAEVDLTDKYDHDNHPLVVPAFVPNGYYAEYTESTPADSGSTSNSGDTADGVVDNADGVDD